MRPGVASACALLLLAATGDAQLTEKQADKQVKEIAKQTRKGHAESVQQRTTTALDAIKTFGDNAPADAEAAFQALFDAIEDYQTGLLEDFRAFHAMAVDDVIAVLADFADGQLLLGQYPKEFRFGTGRALDDVRADMQGAQEKSLAKVRKKLGKVAAKLAKGTDVRLSAHLELATTQGSKGFIQDTVTGYVRTPLAIHTALALGHADSADTGTLLVAGTGQDDEAISVRAVGEGPLEIETADFFELGSPYWHVTFDNDGAGMADGNYLIVAEQDTAGTSFGAFVNVQ